MKNASVKNADGLISKFPVFDLPSQNDIGYVVWAGHMAGLVFLKKNESSNFYSYSYYICMYALGVNTRLGELTGKADVGGGLQNSGPIAMFKADSDTTLVLAAFNNFFSHSHVCMYFVPKVALSFNTFLGKSNV